MTLNPGLLDSPGLYLTGEDNLRLTTFGAVAGLVVALEGRLVTAEGRTIAIAERQVPTSNYTSTATVFPLAEGILTHVQLRIATGSALRGAVFAILEIVRGTGPGAQALGTLIQGYVTTNGRQAWPGSPLGDAATGAGRIRLITGTNPAAGVEITETVPTGVRWRLLSFRASLVASAVVGNRNVSFVVDDGVTVALQIYNGINQVASSTHTYSAAPFGAYGTVGGSFSLIAIPDTLWIPGGFRIRTLTLALDVGDDWTAPVYVVEEFIEA